MKNTLIAFVLVICIIGTKNIWSDEDKNFPQQDIRNIDEMIAVLKKKDISEFLHNIETKGWRSPKIYSLWYVNNHFRDRPDMQKNELTKRELGELMARKLTEMAARVRAEKNFDKLEKYAETLLKLVDWLSNNPGYGNIFLQNRAQDIASVAVVKFVADLNYPIEKAEAWFQRFKWDWNTPEVRQKILAEESDSTAFTKQRGIIQDDLAKEWAEGLGKIREKKMEKNEIEREIFIDPDHQRGTTLAIPESQWNEKNHYKIVIGFGSMNIRDLTSLLKFRKAVGYFPSKPKTYRKYDGQSDVNAAFYETWWYLSPKYKNDKEMRELSTDAAARLYEDYMSGQLCDEGELIMERVIRKPSGNSRKENNSKSGNPSPTSKPLK